MYHVKFFWPDIRPTGYPANETGYPAGYRILKKAGYPVQPYRISDIISDSPENLVSSASPVLGNLNKISTTANYRKLRPKRKKLEALGVIRRAER